MSDPKSQNESGLSGKWLYAMFGAIAVSIIAALVAYGYIGYFTRYWYDDFCTAGTLRQKGFVESQVFWYMNWSGRFSYHVIVNIFESIGPGVVRFLPFLALISWSAATVWTLYQIARAIRFPYALAASFLLALGIVFATLNSTPDIVQSLYWQTGMLSYLFPLVLLTIWAGLLVYAIRVRANGRKFILLTAGGVIINFIGSGMTETYAILQLGVLVLLSIIAFIYFSAEAKKIALPFILAGFIGAALSFAIVFAAPGNKGRQAVLPPPPPVAVALKSAVTYSLSFAERHSRRARGVMLLCLVLPAWLALLLYRRRDRDASDLLSGVTIRSALKITGLTIAAGFFLILICFVPAFYTLSDNLPLRAQILPKFVLVTLSVFSGFILMLGLLNTFEMNRRFSRLALPFVSLALVLILIFVPLAAAKKNLTLADKARVFAARWDEIEQKLLAEKMNGVNDVRIPKINADEFELGFGRPDLLPTGNPQDGPNLCISRYYDLNSLTAE